MRLILLILLTLNLLNAQKIALLIGNDDYSFAPLSNPLNDVDGLYNTLKEIGFDISSKDVLKNASQDKMQKALANFSQRAKNAEIALIYFSGHGMQVNNKNYMLPARTNPQKPVDLWGLVNLDYFIQSATSAKYGIVLVDACRDNPLVKYFQNGKHKGTNAKKGLGQVTPTVGQVVIGFATSAGDTAEDGNGNMSPYAKALSVRLKEPNKDITKVLGLVALDVSAKYEQHPIIRTNLAYDVSLNIMNNPKQTYSLTINSIPSDAKVYITNIKPRYRDGIELEEGKYKIKVKKRGYETKLFNVDLNRDKDIDIALKKVEKNININMIDEKLLKSFIVPLIKSINNRELNSFKFITERPDSKLTAYQWMRNEIKNKNIEDTIFGREKDFWTNNFHFIDKLKEKNIDNITVFIKNIKKYKTYYEINTVMVFPNIELPRDGSSRFYLIDKKIYWRPFGW